MITPLEWTGGKVRFLDQTKLPLQEIYIETNDAAEVVEAIKRLAIRGAPLIGIAAAYAVALKAFSLLPTTSDYLHQIRYAISLLEQSRPTAVNLFWALNRQKKVLNNFSTQPLDILKYELLSEAITIHNEDREMCDRISNFGVELLTSQSAILTHCNAGSLATGGRGTAIGILTKAWEKGMLRHVYVDETRPLLQGARLTVWELSKWSIPTTLVTDNTVAVLMQQKKIDAVIVGADRIARNGDTANKVGTYTIAVLAKYHGIPMYIAAPKSTFDVSIENGLQIPVEQRDSTEVTMIHGKPITQSDITVYSPAFDITPNNLITAIITDRGVCYPPLAKSIENIL